MNGQTINFHMKDYSITGKPTILGATFRGALVHRNSPVARTSDTAFAICEAWGVNPAVALGFFVNESSAGTKGAAAAHLNWGNLREGPGQLLGKPDDGFAYYADWLIGLNDWCKLLRGPLYEGAGLLTVGRVTPRYAPGDDHNDPLRYAAIVNFLCAEWEAMG